MTDREERPPPLSIVYYPHPVLRETAEPYEREEFGGELQAFATKILATMYLAKGVGLAAPQVAVSRRLIVIDASEERDHGIALVNPEIVETEGNDTAEERCLSLPHEKLVGDVKRHAWVRCEYSTPSGEPMEIEGDGLLARVLQHEIDHLDGILFVDRVGSSKKLTLRKYLQELEAEYQPRK